MSISREFVGTPTSAVDTSVTHQPAKARLEPRLGLGPAPTPPAPGQVPVTLIDPKESLGALQRVERRQGLPHTPPPQVRAGSPLPPLPSHSAAPTHPQYPARHETLALPQDPSEPPADLIRTHLVIAGLT